MKKLWEMIKKWAKETAGPWILKSWLQVVNVFIVFAAYGALDSAGIGGAGIIGLWAFILSGYWLFWKLLGADKVIMPQLKKLWHKIFGKKD